MAKARVLVVDDYQEWRQVITEMLNEAGYETIEAESGEQSIEIVRANHLDIVLLDVEMSGISGIETADRLRTLRGAQKLPIILISNDPLTVDCMTKLTPSSDGYIYKHDINNQLIECVERHLSNAAT